MHAVAGRGLFAGSGGSAPLGAGPGGFRVGRSSSPAPRTVWPLASGADTIRAAPRLGQFLGALSRVLSHAPADGSSRLRNRLSGRGRESTRASFDWRAGRQGDLLVRSALG